MRDENNIITVIYGIVGCIIVVSLFIPPFFEMRTFNKFSKTKATYWDAVWANLRVTPD